jgi:hypothetical protein
VLEHVDAGSAAVRVLHQPAQAQAELPGEVDGVVWREREGADRKAIDRARRKTCVSQRPAGRARDQ